MNSKRLLKLANHLTSGNRAHKKFDFGVWNGDRGGQQLNQNGCGYSGCGIGECPELFRRHWKWLHGYPVLRKGSLPRETFRRPVYSGMEFFDLSEDEFTSLFIPNSSNRDSTARQVAARIRRAASARSGAAHG